MSGSRIRLPANSWQPRPYQRKAWEYLENGGKRYVGVWHRRAGKDEICLHAAAVKAHERPATYWHMLPQANQARKAIWEAINPHTGRRRIDEAFPHELRDTTRENEMMIRFKCGSTWQVVGSDNYDSLVGSPPAGVVFSEYSLANPSAWNFMRPILAENGGWAIFIYTPRGPNHGQDLLEMAKSEPGWLAEVLTVDDTNAIQREILDQEKRELISMYGDQGDAIFQQEYYCSFQAAIIGAYYGREMEAAEKENRIGKSIYDPALEVHTAWDLGMSDHTCIVFYQQVGMEVRIVDYYAANGYGLDHYAKVLQSKGYKYGRHYLPHDVEVKELGTGRSRLETLRGLGIDVIVARKLSVEDGINAVRRVMPRMWFEREKCSELIKALRQYRRDWDDERKVYYERPVHDWSSHPADAVRYMCVMMQEPRAKNAPKRELSWVV